MIFHSKLLVYQRVSIDTNVPQCLSIDTTVSPNVPRAYLFLDIVYHDFFIFINVILRLDSDISKLSGPHREVAVNCCK